MIPHPTQRQATAVRAHVERLAANVEPDCAWSGGQCLTRARLKRTVHEMQDAVYAKGLSTRALEMAERRYHQALTEFMAHHCEPGSVGDADHADSLRPKAGSEASSQGPAGPDIAEFERLIDRVCELHARKGMADIAAEYRDARLVLRTRILMLMTERPKRLIDFLEEAEHGGR